MHQGSGVGACPAVALRSCAGCHGAVVSDLNFCAVPLVSPRHRRWKCPPSRRALFLSCHLLTPRSSVCPQPQFPAARALADGGTVCSQGEREPRGGHAASQRLWVQAGSSSRTAVFRRDLIQVNKSPGLGHPWTQSRSCWLHPASREPPPPRAESGTEPPCARPPPAPRHPAALCPSPQPGRRSGRLLWAKPQPSLRARGRADPSKPPQPGVPAWRLCRKVTQPRAACWGSFIGRSLALQRRAGFPPTPVLFARYKHSRNSNRFL